VAWAECGMPRVRKSFRYDKKGWPSPCVMKHVSAACRWDLGLGLKSEEPVRGKSLWKET